MNPLNLPPELPNDSDVERIKARIREQRFVLVDRRRVLLWSFGIGAACGVLLGIWRAADHYVRSTVGGQSGGFYFAIDWVGDLFIIGLLAAACGVGLSILVVGLMRFFRPLYIAFRYSPEEFERQYGDQKPKIG